MLYKVALGLAVYSLTLLALSSKVSADCCYTNFVTGRCDDGVKPFGMYCHAYPDGSCNVVGCNCDGGCRKPKKLKRRSVEHTGGAMTGYDVVRQADTDGNGALDHAEIASYFRRQGLQMEDRDWLTLDANQDGLLSANEIDSTQD